MRDLEYTPPQDTETREAQSVIDAHELPGQEVDETIQSGFVAAKSLHDYQQFPSYGCER